MKLEQRSLGGKEEGGQMTQVFLITRGGGQMALKPWPGVPGPSYECLVSAQWKGI